jgi:hypothetical protein
MKQDALNRGIATIRKNYEPQVTFDAAGPAPPQSAAPPPVP